MMTRGGELRTILTRSCTSLEEDGDGGSEGVIFTEQDTDQSREWLTGFSKRKKAKIEEKRSRAKERDHQAHLDGRRKVRGRSRTRRYTCSHL
jgi:ribosomal RNA-processing protein 17